MSQQICSNLTVQFKIVKFQGEIGDPGPSGEQGDKGPMVWTIIKLLCSEYEHLNILNF